MMRNWTLPLMLPGIKGVAYLLCRSVCADVLLVALLMG